MLIPLERTDFVVCYEIAGKLYSVTYDAFHSTKEAARARRDERQLMYPLSILKIVKRTEIATVVEFMDDP